MFRNLRAEMTRFGISADKLAEITGLGRVSIFNKLNKKTEWSLPEAEKIKIYLHSLGADAELVTIEYLFLSNTVTKVNEDQEVI